jgi:hypothetical protein
MLYDLLRRLLIEHHYVPMRSPNNDKSSTHLHTVDRVIKLMNQNCLSRILIVPHVQPSFGGADSHGFHGVDPTQCADWHNHTGSEQGLVEIREVACWVDQDAAREITHSEKLGVMGHC